MHGGVARDGWRGLGLGYKKLLKDGTPATALVKSFYEMDDESTIGNVQHEFTLEVRVEGREPYELHGLFRMPIKLVGAARPGHVVPVKVHPSDPKKVAIDWKSWDATAPKERVEGASDDVELGEGVVTTSAQAAMPAESRNMMLNGWVAATQSGALSKEEFESTLTDAISAGMVTEAEADAARQQLG